MVLPKIESARGGPPDSVLHCGNCGVLKYSYSENLETSFWFKTIIPFGGFPFFFVLPPPLHHHHHTRRRAPCRYPHGCRCRRRCCPTPSRANLRIRNSYAIYGVLAYALTFVAIIVRGRKHGSGYSHQTAGEQTYYLLRCLVADYGHHHSKIAALFWFSQTFWQLLEMYKTSKGSVSSTPSAPKRGFGTDITNSRLHNTSNSCTQSKGACAGTGMISATLKRSREVEEYRSAVNDLAKRQAQENSPSERFKSFFGASANATPAAAATPSRLRQLLSGSTSTPTAASTPQRASIISASAAVTPRSANWRPHSSPSPSSRPCPTSASSTSRPEATPIRTPARNDKNYVQSSSNTAATSDNRLAAMNLQLQTTTQANDTLQKQVEALRAERRTLKEQLAAKDVAMESLQKQLQDERVKTARLGVDNAKLQAELRKSGCGVIAAPSAYTQLSASKSATATAPQITQQNPYISQSFVAPSPRLPQTHENTTAAPPPPPPASLCSHNNTAPPPHAAFTIKPTSAGLKQSSASLLSQALTEISSKVKSLRHVPQVAQTDRRKSGDPSNWIEAALQQARLHQKARLTLFHSRASPFAKQHTDKPAAPRLD